jgi:uncharacterized protein (DUF1778 family)
VKTTTLPPLRVDPKVKKRIESVLEDGESLSSFMLDAVTRKAQVRREQRAFLRKAAARSKQTERTAKFVPAEDVLERLEKILARAKKRAADR